MERSTVRGNNVDIAWLTLAGASEKNLLAVRRPSGIATVQRCDGQRNPCFAVDPAPPEGIIGTVRIDNHFIIGRKARLSEGRVQVQGGSALCSRIDFFELPVRAKTERKYPRTHLRWNRNVQRIGPAGQGERRVVGSPEPTPRVANTP